MCKIFMVAKRHYAIYSNRCKTFENLNMNRTILILFVLISNSIYSQNGYADWDKNYKYESADKIIQAEIDYAKKVDKDTTKGHYYVAMSKFRFIALRKVSDFAEQNC